MRRGSGQGPAHAREMICVRIYECTDQSRQGCVGSKPLSAAVEEGKNNIERRMEFTGITKVNIPWSRVLRRSARGRWETMCN